MIEQQPAAIYFDGRTSRRHSVTLRFGPTLEIREGGIPIATWAYGDIRQLDAPGGLLRLTASTEQDLARLEISDARLKQDIVTRCNLLAKPPRPRSVLPVAVALSLAALASVGFLVWLGIPYAAERIAPLIPYSWEKRLGAASQSQVRAIFPDKECAETAGKASLAKLTAALSGAANLEEPATINVISSSVPNAFALPGGQVFLFKGLLDKAQSPDEIAGVLAHELGHLKHRDHLRRLIADGGTAYVLGLLFGDVTGSGAILFATRTILGAAYSRDAESAADAFSAETMQRLGRSTRPMGELLVRVSKGSEDSRFSLVYSHPLSEARLAALAREDKGNSAPPFLSDQEWIALKAICR